jgi:hypothetical protein
MARRTRRKFARTRKPKKRGEPNGLEQRHHDEYIKPRIGKEYESVIGYECWTFVLFEDAQGKRVVYTPDWIVHRSDGEIEISEIKGGLWRSDSRIRFKQAAAKYPMFHWRSFLYKGSKLTKEESF